MTPGNREDYLYDDIIDLEIAQREHRQFVSVLRRFARVLPGAGSAGRDAGSSRRRASS